MIVLLMLAGSAATAALWAQAQGMIPSKLLAAGATLLICPLVCDAAGLLNSTISHGMTLFLLLASCLGTIALLAAHEAAGAASERPE